MIGERLGPYEILALINSGGMNEVWKARDARLGRTASGLSKKREISAKNPWEKFQFIKRAFISPISRKIYYGGVWVLGPLPLVRDAHILRDFMRFVGTHFYGQTAFGVWYIHRHLRRRRS